MTTQGEIRFSRFRRFPIRLADKLPFLFLDRRRHSHELRRNR